MQVPIRRIDPSLPLPTYGSAGAAGFDFYTRVDTTVPPHAVALVPANVIVSVPDGYGLVVALRSNVPRTRGLTLANGIGLIDRDYCGPEDEIQIQVYNLMDRAVEVQRGDRIAQGFFVPIPAVDWVVHDAGGPSRGGFGSTG